MEAICPGCHATLKHVQANSAGKIRCGACGHSFELSATGSEAPVDLMVASPAEAETLAPMKPPLGKEPLPASYGLLVAVGYAALLFGAGFLVWQLYRTFQVQQQSAAFAAFQQNSTSLKLKQGVEGLLTICSGLAILLLVRDMICIDRRTSWLVWRSASLDQPVSGPQGSALPYILPFCVSGGVLLIFGLQSMQSGAWAGGMFMPEGSLIVALGAALFLMGLGCGELRRYFWRMSEMGSALVRRKRGDDLTMGPLTRSRGIQVIPGNSSIYIRIAVIALFLAYMGVVWMVLELLSRMSQFYQSPVIQGGAEAPSNLHFYGNLLGGFIGIVGGAFTLFLLTRHWDRLVLCWREAGASTGNSIPRLSDGPSSAFRIVAWITLVALELLALYLAAQVGLREFRITVIALGGMTAMGLGLCWLAGIAIETLDLRRVAARLADGAVHSPKALNKVLAVIMLVLAGISLIWTFYEVFSLPNPFGNMAFWLKAWAITLSVAVTMPPVWLAMMLGHADAIRAHLDGVTER